MRLKDIFESIFYESAQNRANKAAKDKKDALGLIDQAVEKLENLNGSVKDQFSRYKNDLILFIRMLRAYFKGDYKNVPWKTIVKMLTVLVYFIFIIDFVPDFIPFVGYLDDLTLFGWMLKSIEGDLQRFELWEQKQENLNELS